MTTTELLAGVDEEIARLQQVKSLLRGGGENIPSLHKKRKKHNMSAEARKRIGDAQRKRWAAQKKAAK
jgi:hypothetical protein